MTRSTYKGYTIDIRSNDCRKVGSPWALYSAAFLVKAVGKRERSGLIGLDQPSRRSGGIQARSCAPEAVRLAFLNRPRNLALPARGNRIKEDTNDSRN